MKKPLLLIVLISLLSTAVLGHAQTKEEYTFSHINPNSRFSFSGVSAIVSDQNGMIWAGFRDGLYYYNSKEFKQYRSAKGNGIASNSITDLYKDSESNIWVCTSKGLSLYNAKEDSFIQYGIKSTHNNGIQAITECNNGNYIVSSGKNLYKFNIDGPLEFIPLPKITNVIITALYKGPDNNIYIGTENGALFRSNGDYTQFNLINQKKGANISTICMGHEGLLYVGYKERGIDVFDATNKLVKSYNNQYKIANNAGRDYIHKIIALKNGEIWCATSSGIFIIKPNGQSEWINNIVSDTANQNSVLDLHADDQDNVWIGLWGGHIALYNDCDNQFNSVSQIGNSGQRVAACHFVAKDESTLYVGRESGGIYTYNVDTKESSKLKYEHLRIKSLAADSNNNLWIGTFKNGIYYKRANQEGLKRLKLHSRYDNSAIINSIAIDEKHNSVWIGSRFSGVLRYNTKENKFEENPSGRVKIYDIPNVWHMTTSDNGDLIVSSDNGIGILPYGSSEFQNYNYRSSTQRNVCFSHIMIDRDNILIGTQKQGAMYFNLRTKKFTPLNGTQLANLDIYNIISDTNNNIWFSTNNGIYAYYQTSEHIMHFGTEDGLLSNSFFPNSGFIAPNGTILFGSTFGFNYININSIKENRVAPKAFITNIFVNHEPLSSNNVVSTNSKHIENIREIVLSPQNNSLLFEVTSNNMLKSEKNRFKYCLHNYQDKWVEISNGSDIAFTKLPYGKYQLDIISANNDNVWGEITSIDITIMTPLLLRWWAWLIYILIVALIIYAVVRHLRIRNKEQREIEIERHKNAINTEAFEQKMKFFMNVSHELRTPLSLIITPLNILDSENHNKALEPYINAIKRNSNKLLRLTNQILDLRLLEVGKISAIKESHDIVTICRESAEYFKYQISEKRIKFEFISEQKSLFSNVDCDMIDKVVCNLLSNSLKFSADEARLSLQIKRHDTGAVDNTDYELVIGDQVASPAFEIIVDDHGRGIPKDHLPNIFDRFFYDNSSVSGSGIGLHICKEYVALHSGSIRVKSTEGEGTTISVVIPMINSAAPEENSTAIVENINHDSSLTTVEAQNDEETTSDNNKPVVLIADDNFEIRAYLKKALSKKFKCITASNGEQALEMAIATKPSLILLDVIMPAMNGIECVKGLRAHKVTKSMPIILLSGITDDQTVIDGMNAGADCYLSKPINTNLLSAHIARLLDKSHSIVAAVPKKSVNVAVEPNQATSKIKNNLIQNIEAIIEKNYSDSMLDTDYIAQQLKMSRSTLHRHVKKELNIGITEMIRDYRLREAVRLMNATQYNIDELALCVGFNSTSYFCKSFKDKYGTSPKKYSNQLNWSQNKEQ